MSLQKSHAEDKLKEKNLERVLLSLKQLRPLVRFAALGRAAPVTDGAGAPRLPRTF